MSRSFRLRAAWAVAGVLLVFAFAVVRLGARGVATIRAGLTPAEWLALGALTALFVYGEGYRAIQRRYVPWLIRRVEALRTERRTIVLLLAPLQALSLIAAERRILLRAWAGLSAIVAAVIIVQRFPQPWRGITDFAVAAALSWAMVAIAVRALRAFR